MRNICIGVDSLYYLVTFFLCCIPKRFFKVGKFIIQKFSLSCYINKVLNCTFAILKHIACIIKSFGFTCLYVFFNMRLVGPRRRLNKEIITANSVSVLFFKYVTQLRIYIIFLLLRFCYFAFFLCDSFVSLV